MTQKLTTQQQVATLKKGIRTESYKYMYAVEQGEPNYVLEAINNKINKLTIILECIYSLDAEKHQALTVKKAEFVDNSEQILYAELHIAE